MNKTMKEIGLNNDIILEMQEYLMELNFKNSERSRKLCQAFLKGLRHVFKTYSGSGTRTTLNRSDDLRWFVRIWRLADRFDSTSDLKFVCDIYADKVICDKDDESGEQEND